MVIWLEIESWVISKDGPKGGVERVWDWWGKRYGVCWVLGPFCVFWYISAVVVEGAVSGIAEGWGVYGWYSRLVIVW
jgi:hypothetical protein